MGVAGWQRRGGGGNRSFIHPAAPRMQRWWPWRWARGLQGELGFSQAGRVRQGGGDGDADSGDDEEEELEGGVHSGAPSRSRSSCSSGFASVRRVTVNGAFALLRLLQAPFAALTYYTLPDPARSPQHYYLTFVGSLLWLGLMAEGVLELAEIVAAFMHASHAMTGATIVALGAQMPDLVAAVSMARGGMPNGAVAGALGSQVIDVTIGMGLPFLVYSLSKGHGVALDAGHITVVTVTLGVTVFAFFAVTLIGYARYGQPVLSAGGGRVLVLVYLAAVAVIVLLAWEHVE